MLRENQCVMLRLDPYSQAGRIMPPKAVFTLILRTCDYVRPCGRGSEVVDGIEVVT